MLISFALAYLSGGLLGYVIHWVLHQRWSGKLYRLHLTHHEVKYPSRDFLSVGEYRDAGSGNITPYFVALATIVLLPAFFALRQIGVPAWTIAVVAVEITLMAVVNDRIHDALHIKGHFLERLGFFRRCRIAHRVHHTNVKSNLSMTTFEWDRVFGTFSLPDE
ncbi:MAG: sterol desaturase family protein [Rubrivivax sp.]|nr:sterol desaturase family protein [Rubrivivax sp.]